MFDQDGNRKYLNAEERQRFCNVAKRHPDPLRRAFCLLLAFTGCRISEALDLSPDRIDYAERLVIFRTLKQRGETRYRAMVVPVEILDWMREAESPDRVWGFCRTTAWKIVKRCMAEAGLEGVKATPKGLRHSYAVAGINHGAQLPRLRKWMGHTRIENTLVYLDVVGEEEREMARLLWPSLEDES